MAPKLRSNISKKSATVMIGMANSRRNDATNVIHVNTGMRKSVMPGARMLMIVAMKFTAETVEAIPRIWSPKIQKSML